MLGYVFLTILDPVASSRSTSVRRPAGDSRPNRGADVHSLPSYHGAFVAIWVGVPALVLVLVWLLFQGASSTAC